MTTPLFRLNTTESLTVRIPSSEGIKSCEIRYPKDEEWCARVRKLRIVRTAVDRDHYASDVPEQEAADLALFERIRIDREGPEFDASEAAAVIDKIDRVKVLAVEQCGNQFRIDLEACGTTTKHLMAIPSQRDIAAFEKARLQFRSAKRATEILPALEPAGKLYDAAAVASECYAGPVPITHKYAVVDELCEQVAKLAAELEIQLPPE